VFAQVPVHVANESLEHLPLVVLHLGLYFGDQGAAQDFFLPNPAGVFDVLPAPLFHPVKRGVGATQVTLRGLEDGFQLWFVSRLGNDVQDFHVLSLCLRASRFIAAQNIVASSHVYHGRWEPIAGPSSVDYTLDQNTSTKTPERLLP
jgi:hypothetical protein